MRLGRSRRRELRESRGRRRRAVVHVVVLRDHFGRLRESYSAVGGAHDPEVAGRVRSVLRPLVREELKVSVWNDERAIGQHEGRDVVDSDRPAAVGGLDRSRPASSVVVGSKDTDPIDRVVVEGTHVDSARETAGRLIHDDLLVIPGRAAGDLGRREPALPGVLRSPDVHARAVLPLLTPVHRQRDEQCGAARRESDLRIGSAELDLLRKLRGLPGRAAVRRGIRPARHPAVRPRGRDRGSEQVLPAARARRDHELDVRHVPIAGDENVRADDHAGRRRISRRRRERRGGGEQEHRREEPRRHASPSLSAQNSTRRPKRV